MNAPKRNNYFHGRLLTAEDLQTEQTYHRQKQQRANRFLHGAGVVDGLAVSIQRDSVRVSPGYALDCVGRELYLTESQSAQLPGAGGQLYVTMRYGENLVDAVPVQTPDDDCHSDSMRHLHVEEVPVIELSADNPLAGHEQCGGKWKACGNEHAMMIASLRYDRSGWILQRSGWSQSLMCRILEWLLRRCQQ